MMQMPAPKRTAPRIVEAKEQTKEETISAPLYSDEYLALCFADQHKNDLRYCAAWSHWLTWRQSHWEIDETLSAFSLSRALCRSVAAVANKKSLGAQLASAKTIAAVERLARADRRFAATVEQWDADPWLLNTSAGAIDLRTGTMRPHRQLDYCTKLTAVAPKAITPRLWLGFLQRITDGDPDLQCFLQRIAGYALTGDIREHALFFGYGTGANGKSVFVNTLSGMLGTYHRTASIETFVAAATDRHPTELAWLRGARLVTVAETEEGRRWAESRIKQLTGGDPIAARYMRQDFFEFIPQFKLLAIGNHKPGLRSVDEAIRRRLHLIPFSVTIPESERDSGLPERLKQEWPAILAWAIDGCLEWQRVGLRPPAAVSQATAAYLEAEDAVAAWIDECCERDPNAWHSSTDLFLSWTQWATRAGEFVGTLRRFAERLETHGATRSRQPHVGTRGFRGLRIRTG